VGNAAVRALAAGADMVMALGTRETQLETLDALTDAIESGYIAYAELQKKLARIAKLAQDYPCQQSEYSSQQDLEDRALMARAWKRGLTAHRQARAPAPGSKVRLVISADVVSDGVSEAGISADKVAAMLKQIYDVETSTFADAQTFDWNQVPQDGRFVILASTVRIRYNERARQTWKPDLHLVLWNPFQTLDIDAPALITYGFAPPAIEAVASWMRGEIQANGQVPVPNFDQMN
jgi:beta-N-acetylhexosaminidase